MSTQESLMPGQAEKSAKVRRSRAYFLTWTALATLFSLVVQSAFFLRADWMLGDLAYHRGVAYSMMGGDLQGSGPFMGLISYFGGLFPMTIAGLMRLTGSSFEAVESYISWVAPLLLVAAFATLGRMLWKGDGFRAGVLALLGAAAGPLSIDISNLWVQSVVVGSHNYWPVYPRDYALAFVVLASALALSDSWRVRVLGSSASIGLAFLFQAQLGVIGAVVLVAIWGTKAVRGSDRLWNFAREIGIAGGVFLVMTGWWIWPRIAPAVRSGLQLQSFPNPDLFEFPGPLDFITIFGVVGLLAIFGFLLRLFADSDWSARLDLWVGGWLLVVIPLVILATFGGDLGVITERRSWLMLSPAFAVVAAATLGWIREQVSRGWFVAVTALAVTLSVAPAAVGTIPHVREVWPTGLYQGRVFELAEWSPVWDELRDRVAAGDEPEVLASDAFSGAVWTWSGSHIISMVLPGYMKVGFDLEGETGWSYLDRVSAVDEAFQTGLPAVCALASDREIGYVLLEERNGLYAVRDTNPAVAYRVDPVKRTAETVNRPVASGVSYVDLNHYDALRFAPGSRFQLPEWVDTSEVVEIELISGVAEGQPLLNVRQGAKSARYLESVNEGFSRLKLPVDNAGGPVILEILGPFSLVRIAGFEALDGVQSLTEDGMALFERASLCGGE